MNCGTMAHVGECKAIAGKSKKVVAYIDGTNLHLSTMNMGWRLDYRRFRKLLEDKYAVTVAYYFLGYVEKYKNLYGTPESRVRCREHRADHLAGWHHKGQL